MCALEFRNETYSFLSLENCKAIKSGTIETKDKTVELFPSKQLPSIAKRGGILLL